MLKKLFICLFTAAVFCVQAQARVDEVTYLKNGVYSGKIGTYALSGAVYLDAAQAAKLIGGKIYWYPVSGKLLLQIKGKKVVFFMKSNSVIINDETTEFPNPMIVRGGKAFLALNFFISKYFSEAFGFKLDYNPATGTLAAQRAVNITSVNYFSHQDKTRIVVYMEEPLEWQASQKENNLFRISLFGGVISREEKLTIGDGTVRGVDLLQENKMAQLVIAPDDNFGKVNAFKLSDPDRLVIDVSKLAVPVNQSITGEAAGAAGAVPVITPSDGGGALSVSSAPAAGSSGAGVNIPDKMAVEA